jgi:RNA processing factor Prp31
MLILQAIGLLDDLDKELNTYAMRVREWYGWHFPEMTKIVADNIAYAKAVSNLSQVTCRKLTHVSGQPSSLCGLQALLVLSTVSCTQHAQHMLLTI